MVWATNEFPSILECSYFHLGILDGVQDWLVVWTAGSMRPESHESPTSTKKDFIFSILGWTSKGMTLKRTES